MGCHRCIIWDKISVRFSQMLFLKLYFSNPQQQQFYAWTFPPVTVMLQRNALYFPKILDMFAHSKRKKNLGLISCPAATLVASQIVILSRIGSWLQPLSMAWQENMTKSLFISSIVYLWSLESPKNIEPCIFLENLYGVYVCVSDVYFFYLRQ